MDKIIGSLSVAQLATKSVEIVYTDGTSERFNCEGEPAITPYGFFVFQRMVPLPPILINHAQIRKINPSTQAVQ